MTKETIILERSGDATLVRLPNGKVKLIARESPRCPDCGERIDGRQR